VSQRVRAVVVGAGLGGLAAAVRLLEQGYDVTVVERREGPGGRAYQLVDGGYTFDMGPSLITMPWLFEELFALAGSSLGRELRLRPLEPFYRIHWTDDPRTFDFSGDHDRMRAEVARFSAPDAERYDAFMEHSRRIYEQAILVAGRKPFLRLVDFVALVPSMLRLGAIRSLAGMVGRYFEEPHVRQAFDFHSLFIGGDPYRVPAVYSALSYLQVAEGVWYADGGVHSIVRALVGLIERGGGRVRYGEPVTRIDTRDGRVTGVTTAGGEHLPADIVVSNADASITRPALLGRSDRDALPWRLRRPRRTMSCYLLFLGTTRRWDRLSHHTLIVGGDYRGFIRDVTQRARVPSDLSLYLHAPSRTEPAMAREGGESIYVLLPVPNLRSGDDWEARGPELRGRIVRFLEEDFGLDGLSGSIAVEHAFTPADFAARLGAADGNAFGIEPTLFQSAYFRQPNRDRTVSGLYYAGAGTHPGGGIPGVLLTAEVTGELIRRDARSGRIHASSGANPYRGTVTA
jgi:phytoene desaturase